MSDASHNGLRDASVGDLLKRLADDVGLLVRQEIDLVKAELARRARAAGAGAVLVVMAALLGLAVLGALTAALILGLATALSPWAAALVAAGAILLLAAALAGLGVAALRRASPAAAAQSVKEDLEWITDPRSSERTSLTRGSGSPTPSTPSTSAGSPPEHGPSPR